MVAPASLALMPATKDLDKQLPSSTDSNLSNNQLGLMEAPLHIDTPLWNISSPEERRDLLGGDKAMAEGSTLAELSGPTNRQASIGPDPILDKDGNPIKGPDGEPLMDDHRWPGGVVPYVLDPNLSAQERQEVLDGIDEIESKTNVSFVPLPDNDGDGVPDGGAPEHYVRFEMDASIDNGFSSHIGRYQGEQIITTSPRDWGAGTVMHEIMHQLGFYHEHMHPDANNPDNPFTVTPALDASGNPINPAGFGPIPENAIILPYDPFSIMHYSPRPGGNIVTNPGVTINPDLVGESRGELSQGDIDAINQAYDGEVTEVYDEVSGKGGREIPLGNGYTLLLENKDSAWRITDAEGNTVKIWGDPHVDENADGSDEWDFTETTTFMLDDGTKITVGTRDVGEGRFVTDTLTITNGDRAIVVTGVADNNVRIDSSQTQDPTLGGDPAEGGQSIDAAVDDGDALLEGEGVNQWNR